MPTETHARPIKKSQIKELHKRYLEYTGKVKNGTLQPADATDTKSGWFSLTEILDFLKANNVDINKPDEFGLRIYLGFHHPDNSFKPTKIVDGVEVVNESNYYKDTFILVATKKNGSVSKDLLKDDTAVAALEGDDDDSGNGLDNTKLCPPEYCPEDDF